MKKQLATLLLTFIFCFTTVIPGFAADSAMPMADKIGAMEKMLYGTEQSGSLRNVWIVWKMMFMGLLPAMLL